MLASSGTGAGGRRAARGRSGSEPARQVNNLLRGPVGADARTEKEPPSILAAVVKRGGPHDPDRQRRGLFLAWAWDVDLRMRWMRGETGFWAACAGGLISVRGDRPARRVRLARRAHGDRRSSPCRRRWRRRRSSRQTSRRTRAAPRVRTLLPILRNMLFVVLSVMAVMMALSALGVEIGAADRRRRRGRRRDRLRRADAGQGRHQRHVLPARRCLPRRRVHPERQLQGHGRGFSPALGQAAPPSRAALSPCRSARSARSRT